jgi:hypothetical protein
VFGGWVEQIKWSNHLVITNHWFQDLHKEDREPLCVVHTESMKSHLETTISAMCPHSLNDSGPSCLEEMYATVQDMMAKYGFRTYDLPWNTCLLDLNHRAVTTDEVQAILEWHNDHFKLCGKCNIITALMATIAWRSKYQVNMKDFDGR